LNLFDANERDTVRVTDFVLAGGGPSETVKDFCFCSSVETPPESRLRGLLRI